MMLSIAA